MVLRIQGYADAKPSEVIQPHKDPGIVAAAVFPVTREARLLDPPVLQFKGGKQNNKPHRAHLFSEWLLKERDNGRQLAGCSIVGTQEEAAIMGLSLIEELPDASVKKYGKGYRLHYPGGDVNFAEAVALQYYLFPLHIAALRAALKMPEGDKELRILMDRFPAASANGRPGHPLPPTEGFKFVKHVDFAAPTSVGIKKNNKDLNLKVEFGTLDWWRLDKNEDWRRGKTHPSFSLPDWLAVVEMAKEFPDEFAATFDDPAVGKDSVAALKELHTTFKKFDIWTMGRLAAHIRGETQGWKVPDDARDFIMKRALG